MALEKLSQINTGGAIVASTDQIVTVRTGNQDVLTTPGNAIQKAVSDNTKPTVASVSGATTIGHLATFADTAGTVQDGGVKGTAAAKAVSDNTKPTVASVSGATTIGHLATFADTAGTVQDGGAIVITESEISLSDVTTDNVTSSAHGFAPKSPADTTKFLNGGASPTYTAVLDSDLSVSDITTNNVSTSQHGFAPKGDGNAAHFLNGTGAYSAPSSSSAKSIISFADNVHPLTGGTTHYLNNGGLILSGDLSEAQFNEPMPTACTVSNLFANIESAPGGGGNITYTLRKNGSPTSLTCTINGSNTQATDNINTVSFAAGDLWDIQIDAAGGTGTRYQTASFVITI